MPDCKKQVVQMQVLKGGAESHNIDDSSINITMTSDHPLWIDTLVPVDQLAMARRIHPHTTYRLVTVED